MNDKKVESERRRILDAIRDHMEANNITQEEVAHRSGFIQSNISRMLAGKFPPTLDNLIILADACGCEVAIRGRK